MDFLFLFFRTVNKFYSVHKNMLLPFKPNQASQINSSTSFVVSQKSLLNYWSKIRESSNKAKENWVLDLTFLIQAKLLVLEINKKHRPEIFFIKKTNNNKKQLYSSEMQIWMKSWHADIIFSFVFFLWYIYIYLFSTTEIDLRD